MFRPKTLIHLVFGLALILNGIGAAAAPAVMATAGASAMDSAASKRGSQGDHQKVVGQSGCHEHHSSGTPSTLPLTSTPRPGAAGGIDTKFDPAASNGNSTDCCKVEVCGCGCAHQAQVVLAAEFLVMPAIAPASIPWADLAALLSPSLSRPVRPPIA